MSINSLQEVDNRTINISSSPGPRTLGYIPEVDGLRGIAIISVLIFHLNKTFFTIGWVGVHLFFVISGFLITSLLLQAKQKDHYYRNFYARRILRIFPIYYLSLLIATAIGILGAENIQGLFFYLTYIQNYPMGFNNWNVSFPSFLNHTWSLAIEEQFYLVWPFLIKQTSGRYLKILLPLLFFTALLSRIFLYTVAKLPTLIYTATFTQMDALVAGAFLAMLIYNGRMQVIARFGKWVALVSGILIVALVISTGWNQYADMSFLMNLKNQFIYSLLALFFAGCLGLALCYRKSYFSFLNFGFLTSVGKISYGIYLYHWPVFFWVDHFLKGKFAQLFAGDILIVLIKISITAVVATLSYKFIETPMLQLKRHFVTA